MRKMRTSMSTAYPYPRRTGKNNTSLGLNVVKIEEKSADSSTEFRKNMKRIRKESVTVKQIIL